MYRKLALSQEAAMPAEPCPAEGGEGANPTVTSGVAPGVLLARGVLTPPYPNPNLSPYPYPHRYPYP